MDSNLNPNTSAHPTHTIAAPAAKTPYPGIHPLLDIWIRPRSVIRWILSTDNHYLVYTLVIIGGVIIYIINGVSQDFDLGLDTGSNLFIFGLLLLMTPLFTLLALYIQGGLLKWAGEKFGGRGTAAEVRAAIAWGSIPRYVLSAAWIPIMLILAQYPESGTPFIFDLALLGGMLAFFAFLVIGFLYAAVIYCHCLAEAHQFSAWRALGSIMLAGFVYLVPMSVLAACITTA